MTAQEQSIVKDQLSQAMDQWTFIQGLLLHPYNLTMIFLLILGIMLKKVPAKYVADWAIPFIVAGVGIVVGVGLFHIVNHTLPALTAGMLGFAYGGGSVLIHNCSKQFLESPLGKYIPFASTWASMFDAELKTPEPKPTTPQPPPPQ